MKQQIDEKMLTRIDVNHTKIWGRGFIWTGEDWNRRDATKIDLQQRTNASKTVTEGGMF
jgi:hypothetical protein